MSKFRAVAKIFRIRLIVLFVLTLFVGLWTGGFFERYLFSVQLVENFSIAEIEELRGRRFRETCLEHHSKKPRFGRVIGSLDGEQFLVRISIEIEDEKFPMRGYPKSYFRQCARFEEE